MWTQKDMNQLKTFDDFISDVGQSTVFANTTIDEATQGSLIEWYGFRKVCDNDRFLRYFQRQLNLVTHQYEEYLRIESVQIDPMVSEYLERQIKRKGTDSGTVTRSNQETRNLSNKVNTTESGTDESTTTRDLTAVHDGTRDTTSSGSGTVTTDTTGTSKVDGTGTVEVKDVGEGTNTNTRTSNNKHLSGNLPQSSINAGGGFPDSLNWEYLTQQDESKDTTTDNGTKKDNNTQTTTRNTTDTTTTDGNTQQESTTIGTDEETSHSTDTDTGTIKTDGTTSLNRDVSGTDTGTVESEGQDVSNKQSDEDTRERYTGRHEAPQDMLDRAREYILSTNAFKWLRDQVEVCFMCVYEI